MSSTPGPVDRRALLKEALDAVERMQAKLDAAERRHSEPIAIVGIGCRIPGGASTPETFWTLLREGLDAIREAPPDRWDREAYARLGLSVDGDRPMHPGGFLDQIDRFDARFFGLSPREAATLDPQHRLLLEVCWEALEHAGQAPDRLSGSATGVFVGISTWEYSDIVKSVGPRHIDLHAGTGTAHNTAAGRISYVLGLRGPCLAVDTACSSSLVAVHLACESLRRGESRLALAGGVNAIVIPDAFALLTRAGVLAPDGRCKTFDEAADGFVRAEGCGIVILKRLSDALADRDNVLAVIRGSAINQDGASSGLTVPNGLAQQEVIRQALAAAKVAPAEVAYVEAHGTGTSLGDPIELEALATVLGVGRSPDRPFMVGSVKTNIGHLEAAAGVVGLIKVVLALQHQEIPPHLHFKKLTPRASMGGVPVIVPTTRTPWPPGPATRIAGVSAFGLSGTNAHVIVAEPPVSVLPPVATERPVHLLALSAKSEAALTELAGRYERRLAESTVEIGDVCFTAATGRAQFAHRLALTVRSEAEAREALGRLASGQPAPRANRGRARSPRPRVAFLFTGQGSQYVDMGRDLYRTSDTFRRVLDRCDALLRPLLPQPLLSVMYPEAGAPSPLDETHYTQPALFALEYALAETWREWGITPSLVLGHSVGEYVAACVAGVLGLEDALGLIAVRGRLMQSLPAGGAMAAVFTGEAEVAEALREYPDQLAIAAVNAPDNVVVSGAAAALAAALEQLARRGIRTQPLTVSHAFHSPLMEPILDEFAAAAGRVRLSTPRIGLVSNVTGRLATAEEMTSAGYWRRHVRAQVRFAAGLATLREQGIEVFVEVGPAPTLLGLGRRVLGDDGTAWLPSLRKGGGDWEQMIESLGRLYVEGLEVDWAGLDRPYPRRRVALPAYPFQRERYWVEPARDAAPTVDALEGHPFVGRRITSPRLQEAVFQYAVRSDHPAFLGDHRVHGTVVFPGTAYLETMLAVARTALGDAPLDLAAVTIRAPMILDGDAERMVQVIMGAPTDGSVPVEVFSRPMDDERAEAWQLHATARVAPRDTDGCGHPEHHPTEARRRCSEAVVVSDFYEQLAGMGLDYGETFRGVRELWRGEAEGFGLVETDAARLSGLGAYHAHPAVLDACLHLFGVAVSPAEPSSDVYVPVGVERFRLFRSPEARVWGRATVARHQMTEGTLVGDLHLFDDAGAVVACLTGISLRRMPPEALGRAVTAGWLYEVAWRPQALAASSGEHDGPGRWLILADRGGVGEALARRLEAQGHRCELAFAGGEEPGGDPPAVDVSSPDGFARWWGRLERPAEFSGVVHLWSLDAPSFDVVTAGALERGEKLGVGSALHLVQAVVAGAAPLGKVVLVTRGAQRTGGEVLTAPTQALLWGLARVVRSEHPSLEIACVDLDPMPGPDEGMTLAAEVLGAAREDEIALRVDGRHVARLVARVASAAEAPSPAPVAGEAVRLEITTRGILDNLRWAPVKRTPPGPGQVEIEVQASGLNFRDVLNTLGMYPGDAGGLGSECAGRVCAIGDGVEDLQTGDDVIAMTSPAFATHVTAEAQLVVRKPAAMTMDEAATIPITFLTAAYGLHELGRIKPGERVLIHAAAGGVGLAALQVARRAGAEIFATAGSPAKRDYLASLGVRHVMDSRSLRFADEVMAATDNEGIDIVLNSLSGDFIPASLRTLREGGRFIEIGKRGVWDQTRVAAVYPGVIYHVFYLGEACAQDPQLIGSMLRTVVDDMARGDLTPLPLRTFAGDAAADAFRYMAQARHIGKVVVTPPAASRAPLAIRGDATYLVTGGLGALGLQVARWLHDEGARHLVLMGRSEPSRQALEAIRTLETGGSRVQVARGDVSCAADVSRVLEAAASALPPLRGVVHAAGVLDDGVLVQQSWERFVRVMAPKVAGAINLHRLTDGTPLDLFVLFSSASALLGSPGQANYVAANAFLDALAHHRRALGLPAISINWGPWAGGGMAAAAESRPSRGPARGGVRWITPERGRALLARVIREPVAQVGVLSIDWPALAAATPAHARRPFLTELVGGGVGPRPGATSAPGQLRAQLVAAAPAERAHVMVTALKDHLASVLRTSAEGLDVEESLTQLGIDSLMAVELKNRIETDLGLPTPVGDLLEGPSLSMLAASLCRRLDDAPARETPVEEPPSRAGSGPVSDRIVGSGEDARQLLVRLPSLDDVEISRLLLARGEGEAGPASGAEPRAALARQLEEEARAAVVHPTSHGQQALWFLHHLAPESPAYHVLFAARVRSAVKPDVLQSVFQALVDRHPALRTTFPMEGDRPIQRVHGEWPVRLEHVDARAATSDELRRLVTASARRPFDLEHGPIARATLFTHGPDGHVLLLAIHHIAIDAWSFEVLFRDFGELYASAEAGRPASLAPLPCRYSDFVGWQEQMLQGPAGDRARRYWEAELAGELPQLTLRTDRPRPPRPRFRGASLPFLLDEALSGRLKELAAGEGATPYMVLLAAYQVLLRRETNQDEILVGSPVAGRARPEFSSIIGYFVNTVVVRGTTAGNPTFRAFLRAIRDKALRAIEHQDYPFPLLVKELGVSREGGRSPVFQTLFNFIRAPQALDLSRFFVPNHPGGTVRIGALVVEPFPLAQQEGQFDLELEMSEIAGTLGGRFKYDTDLFARISIARLAEVFKALLDVIASDPDLPVSSIIEQDNLLRAAAETSGQGGEREEIDL
jgi:acyl transferase domain-containing protein/acyl carrier protein